MPETDDQGRVWLWPEDVAARCQKFALYGDDGGETIRPESIGYYVSETRRRLDAGTVRPYDIPMPDRRVKRRIPRRHGGTHTIWSNQWLETTITPWLAIRADRAAHGYGWDRARNESGKFLSPGDTPAPEAVAS